MIRSKPVRASFSCRGKPNTRMGWHNYFAARFSKTGAESAAQMALFYMVMALYNEEITE